MEWNTIVPATPKIPQTGNPWIDWLTGALIPIALGIVFLLVKWLRKYLKNKIKEQEIKEHKLTQEINLKK